MERYLLMCHNGASLDFYAEDDTKACIKGQQSLTSLLNLSTAFAPANLWKRISSKPRRYSLVEKIS